MCRYFARRTLLVGPVAVLIEVPPGTVLVVAIAVARHGQAVEEVDQPDGHTGSGEQGKGLGADRVPAHDENDEAGENHERRQHPAHQEERVPPARAAAGTGLGHAREATAPPRADPTLGGRIDLRQGRSSRPRRYDEDDVVAMYGQELVR